MFNLQGYVSFAFVAAFLSHALTITCEIRRNSSKYSTAPMPAFDPVRDAVLNSPLTGNNALPSPSVALASSSTPTSYFPLPPWHPQHQHQHPSGSSSIAVVQSPTASRRATDLSMLLNADDHVPSPSSTRRPSSSGTSIASGSTPRTRSSNLSHILQQDPEPSGAPPLPPPPRAASGSGSRAGSAIFTASPTSSPPITTRDIVLPPSLSRGAETAPSPQFHNSELPRRLSSTTTLKSSPSPLLPHRSPETSRPSTSSMPPPPISVSPEPQNTSPPPPQRTIIPYAPRHRRTPADSVLKPISDLELEFYKNCVKNPLRARALRKQLGSSPSTEDVDPILGKRRRDMVSKGDLRPSVESPGKRSRDVEKIADHCTSLFFHSC